MKNAEFSNGLTRRGLFAGTVVMTASAALCARAFAAEPLTDHAGQWSAYEARLRARLQDAGGGAFEPDFARVLLTEANRFRSSQRLGSFTWDDDLAACASAQAADMASRNYFGHESPEGFTYLDRAALLIRDLCGGVSENLAWRKFPVGGANPSDFETMWEQSPAHRANLVEPASTRAGYGVVRVGSGYFAAGVYADAAVQLAKPVPLRVGAGADLSTAINGAVPQVERVALTRPGEALSQAPAQGPARALENGVWQLRPLQAVGGDRYAVLSGPIFFVA